MIETYKALEDAPSMLTMLKMGMLSFHFLLLFPGFRRGLSSLPLHSPLVLVSFTPLLCLTIPVARDSFLFSTCTEGQTPSLQPAGILFMLQSVTKLDSRGRKQNRATVSIPAAQFMKDNNFLEMCD